MSEDDPNKLPPNPPTLNYTSNRYGPKQPGVSTGGQVVLGFVSWLFTLIVLVAYARGPLLSGIPFWMPIMTALSGLIGLTIWLRVRHGWRSFVIGLLLGFGITCLVPLGIAAVICGTNGGKI